MANIKRIDDPYGEEDWDEPKKKEIINGEIEKVKVYVMLSGDYCAFHEVSLRVVYDITNDCKIGFNRYTKKELDEWEFADYSDVQEYTALKVGKKYYVLL